VVDQQQDEAQEVAGITSLSQSTEHRERKDTYPSPRKPHKNLHEKGKGKQKWTESLEMSTLDQNGEASTATQARISPKPLETSPHDQNGEASKAAQARTFSKLFETVAS
jgi:hypothetical protein